MRAIPASARASTGWELECAVEIRGRATPITTQLNPAPSVYLTNMPLERWLEFHDSKLTGVRSAPDGICVDLDAYVHQWEGVGDTRRGTGWMQPLQIELRGAYAEQASVVVPVGLWRGRVVAASLPDEDSGTLSVPAVLDELVTLELETTSGETLRITGTRMAVTETGERRFVENLRCDMDPDA